MTSSCAFWPAPNWSAIVVYAAYWVESCASDDPSGSPSRIERAGMATASSASTATAMVAIARPVRIGLGAVGAASCAPTLARARLFNTRIPSRLSSAGVKVTATSTAMSTQTAPTVPMTPRNGMPVTLSASSATRTVEPANTTALPDVPLARPIDSRSSIPEESCRR